MTDDQKQEFDEYVEKYAKAYNLTIDQALEHAIVKAYKQWLIERW